MSKHHRKNRHPKIVNTAAQAAPPQPHAYHLVGIEELFQDMHDHSIQEEISRLQASQPEPRLADYLDDRLFRNAVFNPSAGARDYPAQTEGNTLTFGKLKEQIALLRGDYAAARQLHEQSRVDRPHGSVDPIARANAAAAKLGWPPATPEQAQHLREVMRRTALVTGIPLPELESSLNEIMASIGRPGYDEVSAETVKYEPVALGIPSKDQTGPTATLEIKVINTLTGEPLFELDPLICSAGANLVLGPADGDWQNHRLEIRLVSIDPDGDQDEDLVAEPTWDVDLGQFARAHFICEGRTVRCQLTHRGYVEEGLARCHPDDAYDFSIGRKLALKRAMVKVSAYPHSKMWPSTRAEYWDTYFQTFPEDRLARKDR